MGLLKDAGKGALDKWKTQPIGGEIRPEVWGADLRRPAEAQASSRLYGMFAKDARNLGDGHRPSLPMKFPRRLESWGCESSIRWPKASRFASRTPLSPSSREEKGPGDGRLELDMPWQDRDDFAKHLRHAPTPAEYLMWQLIRNQQRCQAKFRRQHKLGPYLLDFFCPDAKLVIECDGLLHFTPVGIKKDRIRS